MQICLLKPGDITTVNRIEFHFFSNRPALVSWFAMASNEQSNCIELSFASTRSEQQWDRLWVIYYHSLVDFAALSKQTKSFCSSVETVATSVGVRSGLGCMSIYHIAAARRCGSSRLIAVVLWLASGFSVRYKLPACNTAMHAMQNECRNSQLITNYTVSKNVPPLVWISFRVQLPISIIFGNSESKKKSNGSLFSGLTTAWFIWVKTETQKLHLFTQMLYYCTARLTSRCLISSILLTCNLSFGSMIK